MADLVSNGGNGRVRAGDRGWAHGSDLFDVGWTDEMTGARVVSSDSSIALRATFCAYGAKGGYMFGLSSHRRKGRSVGEVKAFSLFSMSTGKIDGVGLRLRGDHTPNELGPGRELAQGAKQPNFGTRVGFLKQVRYGDCGRRHGEESRECALENFSQYDHVSMLRLVGYLNDDWCRGGMVSNNQSIH